MAFNTLTINHPLRIPLAAEVHSRPSLELAGAETLTHLAVFARSDAHSGDDTAPTQLSLLAQFCGHFGVAAPGVHAKYFFHDFGGFRLKWECHTEFATYTFLENHLASAALVSDSAVNVTAGLDEVFARLPLRHIPQWWLAGLQGKVMVAAHLALIAGDSREQPAGLRKYFEGGLAVGSELIARGEVWTDFLIQADGFGRFVLKDFGFLEQQAGRTVQRLLEIETYRMMALLGLPQAQSAAPVLTAIENELVALTATLTRSEAAELADTDAEQAVLRSIIDLAARLEQLTLENSYRFSASKAYFSLVKARILELRETRIEGLPTIAEFMDRRLAPAMHTCEAIVRRQEALAARIANTNDLLRTRVGIMQEQQNRKILQSMNARAAQQLRLQQAVEGLSVAAISYYVAGLFLYTGKGLKALGLNINPELLTGVLIPVIALTVWYSLRRMHRKLH
ncbi:MULTISPECIES: DUF3422 domain-containing protein [unclassified Undibacterium]|uniref:DUF3422 family protein n=1 Tax=unclassified Undibacterium TaxID=2630295 RepID=UPI002AC90AF8|nr:MULTISPECIES: DUF3422 domain-containing protein [unclassified Undibacterium]MEB0139834.1 DUF3422 domain-containing protein [Undibacterium sp. CCC2.1]MEB0172764.1 DUF3422 domain-containing protein [Undibacterium sp. CCC1.1]MEB0176556.1 DUF3422 domain-containing protein [Undibacterium sp. CCC3.4]MEB0215854.1 DUF3422 domain-containing protein [Undibacterium sp. 5I2]WPX42705.1 DUF3422 domain-containing protein [Undibacterium sp. CCC3.4]